MNSNSTQPSAFARAVFAGLTPSAPPVHRNDSSRIARGVKHTVPVLLVGSLAATMLNLTGAVEPVQAAPRAAKPKPTATEFGKTVRQAIAGAGQSVASAASAVVAIAPPPSYTVVAGDTVSDIAMRYGLSTASVLALNGLSWSTLIHPGQQLKLTGSGAVTAASTPVDEPTSGRYTIVDGDTVSGIAERFGLSTLSILTANGLGWSSIIYPGQTIVIPGVPDPAAVAPPVAPVVAEQTPSAPVEPVAAEPIAAEPIAAEPVVQVQPIVDAPPAVAGEYTVQSGDTLSGIAAAHGVGLQSLLEVNGLDRTSIIFGGQSLRIPLGGAAPAAAAITPAQNAPAGAGGQSTGGPSAGGSVTGLTDEMRGNAAVIVQVGRDLGVSDYGIVIALATAMQESSLRNLTWGDRDSVGLFQQRPSTGWGSVDELTTPSTAANLFYTGRAGYTRGLLDIAGWESMALTVAAQTVQISAYPDAYAKWETSAWSWLAQLR